MKKRLLYFFVSIGILLCALLSAMVVKNNYFAEDLSIAKIGVSFDRAVDWIQANETEILQSHNPGLWEMLAESAVISGDKYLAKVLSLYQKKNRYNYSDHPLKFQVYGQALGNYKDLDLYTYPDYNLLYMYAFSCDESLSQYEIVKQQISERFCDRGLRGSVVCQTHQIHGMLYFRDSDCVAPSIYEPIIVHLVDDIARWSFFEFRVLDNYLQRVMQLYRSGNPHRVRDKWIQNIIEAQNPDGGWDDVYQIFQLNDGRYLGIEHRKITVETATSDFHATIQGVLLLAHLKQQLMQL